MKVVLIWNEVGVDEPIKMYLINNPSDKDLALLDKANGKIINKDLCSEEVSKVWDYISRDVDCALDANDKDNGKWMSSKISIKEDRPVICESTNRIYICGAYF